MFYFENIKKKLIINKYYIIFNLLSPFKNKKYKTYI